MSETLLRFVKLLDYEVRRFRYILAALMGLTAVIQIGSLVYYLNVGVAAREEQLMYGSSSLPIDRFSLADVLYDLRLWHVLPIAICVVAIAIYVLFIWYRDWFGRNTFIYRLLMLPQSRSLLYWSKGSAIVLFVLGLVAFQLLLLPLEYALYQWIVPEGMREASHATDMISANRAWQILMPRNADHFALSYGLGIVGVSVAFTSVLLERSYRGIGVLYGIAYAFVCGAVIFLPYAFLGLSSPHAYLYPVEIFAIKTVCCVAVLLVSVGLGCRLLNRKITV